MKPTSIFLNDLAAFNKSYSKAVIPKQQLREKKKLIYTKKYYISL